MKTTQRFTGQAAELRERRAEDSAGVAFGYGAVYYRDGAPETEYRIWDDLVERIIPGAFDRAISQRQDVRGLFNHDVSQVLGRTVAGTLTLTSDQTGLRYEIDLPETRIGQDLAVSLRRGDVSGSSFSFIPQRVTWVEEGELLIREIRDLDLYDVGPVAFPAYRGTTAGVRCGLVDELEDRELADLREEMERARRELRSQGGGRLDVEAEWLRIHHVHTGGNVRD